MNRRTSWSALVLLVVLLPSCKRAPDMSRGGVEWRFSLDLPAATAPAQRQAALATARDGVVRRAGALKVPVLCSLVGDALVLQIPAGVNLQQLRATLTGRGLVEFRLVEEGGEARPSAPTEASARAAAEALRGSLAPGQALGFEAPSAVDGRWAVLVLGPAELTGDAVQEAKVRDGEFGVMDVAVTLSPEGAERFAALTGRAVKRRLAITLDGRVLMAPTIQQAITGGSLVITLGRMGTREEMSLDAQSLVATLRSRALPAPLIFESEVVVAPAR